MKGIYLSLCSHIPCTSWKIPLVPVPSAGLQDKTLISRPSEGDFNIVFSITSDMIPCFLKYSAYVAKPNIGNFL